MSLYDLSNVPDVLTIHDLQSLLNIGRSTAYRLVRQGMIGHVRIGKVIRIPKRYVVDFICTFAVQQQENYTSCVAADNTVPVKNKEVR